MYVCIYVCVHIKRPLVYDTVSVNVRMYVCMPSNQNIVFYLLLLSTLFHVIHI